MGKYFFDIEAAIIELYHYRVNSALKGMDILREMGLIQ